MGPGISRIEKLEIYHSNMINKVSSSIQEAAEDLYLACRAATGVYKALKLIGADKALPGYDESFEQLNNAIKKAQGHIV